MRFSVLPDTAGELSPSAPSPRSGEGWGEAAALWIRQQYPKGCRARDDQLLTFVLKLPTMSEPEPFLLEE